MATIIVAIFFSIVFFRQITAPFSFLYNLAFNKNIELKTEQDGTINILLLGIRGASHAGPDLTDTIIFANINPSTKTVHLISIPRDLWITQLKGKINKAYSIGQEKEKNGILLAKAAAEQVVGLNINYVVVLDFQGFVKLVDFLGGIDVVVLHTLDDYNYPIDGKENDTCGKSNEDIKQFSATASAETAFWNFFSCRYKHVHVGEGQVHMNGETALEFVRSRHAAGSEGTDFARSTRQQRVISAIRERVFSLGIILNPVKIIGIYNILASNINTDIKSNEFDDFIKLAQKLKGAKIQNSVIDEGDNIQNRSGLLFHPDISEKENFEWVLMPRIGDGEFAEIHEYVSCIITDYVCVVGAAGIEKAPQN